jgi:hypothetical protein
MGAQTRYYETRNPHAPPAYQGLVGVPERATGPCPRSFSYVFDQVLTANQAINTFKVMDNEADFIWWGTWVSRSTGAFTVRFADANLRYQSDAQLVSAGLSFDPAAPYPTFPQIIIPAGGRIGIDITDISGAPNTIQIVFMGAKVPVSAL